MKIIPLVLSAALFAAPVLADSDADRCAAREGNAAIAACSDVIGIGGGPELAWAYFDRARAYFNMKLYASAADDLTEVLKLKPGDVQALENRGLAYIALGYYQQAIADFNALAELQPQEFKWPRERCWARAAAGRDLDDALEDCNKALALHPGDSGAFYARCLVQYRNAAYAASIADCSAALAADPKFASSLYVRGLAKRKTGDVAGGDADVAAAKSLAPRIGDTYAAIGVQ